LIYSRAVAKHLKAARGGQRELTAAVVIREIELPDLAPVFALGQRLFTAEKWPTLYRSWDQYELVHLFGTNGDTHPKYIEHRESED
jgi:hypothetical protein